MRLCYIDYSLLYNKLFPNLLKQQICIVSVWGQEFEHSSAECLCFRVCRQTALKVVARDGVSSEGSSRGRFAPKLSQWLLAGFGCSQAIGLRASAPHWPSVATPLFKAFSLFFNAFIGFFCFVVLCSLRDLSSSTRD